MICSKDSTLLVLSKAGFDNIIGKLEQHEIEEKVDFMKKFSFIKNFTKSKILSIM